MREEQQSNVKSKWVRFFRRGARRPPAASWAVAGLLVALVLQLTAAAAHNSASWDEPAHVYAGWLQWTRGHYTVNPPLTRYLLAAPLLGMELKEPPIQDRPVRVHEIKGGRDFVFQNDADAILFRSRMVVVTLAMLTALLVFLAGFEFGPSPLNPYEQFKTLEPADVIDHGVFVFEGHFEIPLAAALSHVQKADALLQSNDPHAALGEAQRAQALAPESPTVLSMVGQALEANHEPDQAAEHYRKALALAEATQPAFQNGLIADLRRRLGSKPR